MNVKKEYEYWLTNAKADADIVAELEIMDDAKIEDAFYRSDEYAREYEMDNGKTEIYHNFMRYLKIRNSGEKDLRIGYQ